EEGEQGFYYVGHCYQYLDDADRAIARYEAFLKEYPRSEYVGYAHLNAIDTLRSAGRLEEAPAWAARPQSHGNQSLTVINGLFQGQQRHVSGSQNPADAGRLRLRPRQFHRAPRPQPERARIDGDDEFI